MIGRGKLRKENEVCANGNVIGIRNIFLDANMRILCLAYFCFGISSIIYTTYFVNYMVGERNIDQIMAGNIWSLVGLVSIGSAVIWGRFSDCFGRPLALSIIFVLQAISYFFPIISPIVLFMWVSELFWIYCLEYSGDRFSLLWRSCGSKEFFCSLRVSDIFWFRYGFWP